jgi:DNA-binding Lrp family transcriptional regulator
VRETDAEALLGGVGVGVEVHETDRTVGSRTGADVGLGDRVVAAEDDRNRARLKDGGVVATIGVRVTGDTRRVAARLADVEEIEYVVLTAGSFDLILELVCETEDELLSVINEAIRGIDGVRETETFMHLRAEKNVFAWGQRLRDTS